MKERKWKTGNRLGAVQSIENGLVEGDTGRGKSHGVLNVSMVLRMGNEEQGRMEEWKSNWNTGKSYVSSAAMREVGQRSWRAMCGGGNLYKIIHKEKKEKKV